jgi:hypothetical protein
METAMKKKVELWAHTSCGLEFDVIDVETRKSLTGRMFWCTDEELENGDFETEGFEHFRKKCEKAGWEVVEECWS